MPWKDISISHLVDSAQVLIQSEFGLTPLPEFYLCTRDELIQATLEELRTNKINPESIRYAQEFLLPSIIGKFFKLTKQIWLVDGLGTNIDTILHELLHSIQECFGSREPITDFITFHLTGNRAYINEYDLENWLEIEKKNGWIQIKKRYIKNGDCEEF